MWNMAALRRPHAVALDLCLLSASKLGPVDQSEGRPLPLNIRNLTDDQLEHFIQRLSTGIANGIIEGRTGVVKEPDEPKLQ